MRALMNKPASLVMVVALSAGLLSAGCKKTVEGENKAWDHNIQHINELAALYPGFANALHEQRKRAEEAMAEARSIGDKEAAARKMADANSMIDGGFVSTLGQLESRTRALRDKLVTSATEAEHGADQVAARAATDDAQRILRGVDDALKSGAADAVTATVVLRKIDGDLSSAGSNLDRVIASAKQRKAEAAKAAAATGPTGATSGGAVVAKVQWKCSYCNAMNDDSKQKCQNCGAPRSAAKTQPVPKKK